LLCHCGTARALHLDRVSRSPSRDPEGPGPGWSNVRASSVTLERTLLIELFDQVLP